MKPARLIAAGFGLGFAPRAPGTVASAAAVVLGALLISLDKALLPLATLAAIVVGMWAIGAVAREARGELGDPKWIVIDEVAGQWVALLGLARLTPLGVAAAFLVFRLLDITKLGPVGWVDRQRGPAAVMGDDLVAGFVTAIVMAALSLYAPQILDARILDLRFLG